MAEQEDTTIKEPRPNNPEEAKEYQKQTKIALQKFTDRIHGFDRYQHKSAYELDRDNLPLLQKEKKIVSTKDLNPDKFLCH